MENRTPRTRAHAAARGQLSSRHGAHTPLHHLTTRLAVQAGGGEGRAVVAPKRAHAARVDVGGVHVRAAGEGGARVRVRPRALSCRPRRRRRRHALADLGGGASQQRRHAARPRAHREARATQLGLHVVVVERAPVRRTAVACRRRSGVSCGAVGVRVESPRPRRVPSYRRRPTLSGRRKWRARSGRCGRPSCLGASPAERGWGVRRADRW